MKLLRYWALSRKGTRSENQDVCHVPSVGKVPEDGITAGAIELSDDGQILVVADGVGGGPDGGLAASTAAVILGSTLVDQNNLHLIRNRLSEADKAVQALKSSRGRPATTIAGMSFSNKEIQIFNVGDTRIYDLTCGISILSQDHCSTVDRRSITRFLGGGIAQSLPAFATRPTLSGAYLICTDGLYNFVSVNTFTQLLDGDPRNVMVRIFDQAQALGSDDNLSAIFCNVTPLNMN